MTLATVAISGDAAGTDQPSEMRLPFHHGLELRTREIVPRKLGVSG